MTRLLLLETSAVTPFTWFPQSLGDSELILGVDAFLLMRYFAPCIPTIGMCLERLFYCDEENYIPTSRVGNFVTHSGFRLLSIPKNSFSEADDRRLDPKSGLMHEFHM